MLLSLVRWLWYVNPYVQYVFTAALFIIAGERDQDDDFAVLYNIDL